MSCPALIAMSDGRCSLEFFVFAVFRKIHGQMVIEKASYKQENDWSS